ncbi:hypothetical protein HK104_004234 [Borealophlyctis nickersoniae]|nr:hypothetical protein HK104_004234 [Borealophlyctis nickersoniae]
MEAHPQQIADQCFGASTTAQRLGFQVYMDLIFAKEWARADITVFPELDKVVILGRRELEVSSLEYLGSHEQSLNVGVD